MQKFINTLPLLAIAALIWFHFQQPKSDRPKLAKPPSETESLRCEVVKDSIYDGDTFCKVTFYLTSRHISAVKEAVAKSGLLFWLNLAKAMLMVKW